MPIEVAPVVESITIIINLRESLGCLILMQLFFFWHSLDQCSVCSSMDNSTEQMINWGAYWRYFNALLIILHRESDDFLQPVHAGHEQTDCCALAAQWSQQEHEIQMETCFTLAPLYPIQLRLLSLVVVLQLWSCIWPNCLVLLLSNNKKKRVKCWSSAIQWFSHLSPPSFLSHCVANKE